MPNVNIEKKNEMPASELSTRSAWDPFREFRDMLRYDPFRDWRLATPSANFEFAPAFDVKETPEAYVFKADMPGVKEADLHVSVSGNTMTVTGKRENETKKQGETYYTYERSYGSFSRSFTMPTTALCDQSTAELREGVLTLWVPKKTEAQPKKIPVSTTEKGRT